MRRYSEFIFCVVLISNLSAFAMLNSETLERRLFSENREIAALQSELEAKHLLAKASVSVFLPQINLIGGWQDNRTDELGVEQRGYNAYLQGAWNLFSGFRDVADKTAADLSGEIARLELEKAKKQLGAEMRASLAELIVVHKYEDFFREELEMVMKLKPIAARKASSGVTGSVDKLEFDLREAELNIEIKQNAQLHEQTHEKLFSLFGSPVSDEEAEKLDFDDDPSGTAGERKFNVESNIDYQLAQAKSAMAAEHKRVERADYLPRLDLSIENGRITPVEKMDYSTNENKFGLTLTWNLFSGFKTYRQTAAASAVITSAEHRVRQSALDFERSVNTLKIKLEQLRSLFELNQIKLSSLKKYYELTADEYKRGIKNSSDMVNAIDRYSAAKKKKFELLKDIDLASLELNNLN